ncbi:MAG: hypothetical protein KGN35_02375 [Betaproteobacteria bacterium]|nr:hypothetical protein [Betaproteobacteria bacterium]
MIKELSFDDEDDVYQIEDFNDEDDVLTDSKIPAGKFAKIIDEFETTKDEFDDDELDTVKNDLSGDDDDDVTLDMLGLR